MSKTLRASLLAAAMVMAGQAAADVTFYENDGFSGRSFTGNGTIWNLGTTGFNDRASSAVVSGGSWEVCSDARFEGRCVILQPGEYPSLRPFGINDRISSAREVDRYGSTDRHSRRNDSSARNNSRGDRYDYRDNGWRYDRWENRWERY